jgi:hypothetical protein
VQPDVDTVDPEDTTIKDLKEENRTNSTITNNENSTFWINCLCHPGMCAFIGCLLITCALAIALGTGSFNLIGFVIPTAVLNTLLPIAYATGGTAVMLSTVSITTFCMFQPSDKKDPISTEDPSLRPDFAPI